MIRKLLHNVYALFSMMVVAAIIIAVLYKFNWDVTSAFMFVVNWIVDTTLKMADYISKLFK